MARNWKVDVGIIVVLAILGAIGVVFLSGILYRKPVTLRGAVMVQNTDPRKQLPIAGVEVTASGVFADVQAQSDASGFFSITLPKHSWRGEPITLKFEHAEYKPLEMREFAGDKVYLAYMVRTAQSVQPPPNHPTQPVSNVVVRYSAKATSVTNIGSAVKTFEVVNTGNVPCQNKLPCSPDKKWKAATGSVTLAAGPDSQFRNVRASCIAGPCPFTEIQPPDIQENGSQVKITAINWSDTATFLVEAEVVRAMISNATLQSYPVIFGRALNFTLPESAEGLSLQADLNGQTIVFPLGPDLKLEWGECTSRTNDAETKVYRCELKPGYRFK